VWNTIYKFRVRDLAKGYGSIGERIWSFTNIMHFMLEPYDWVIASVFNIKMV
jgi:hypothetical protein